MINLTVQQMETLDQAGDLDGLQITNTQTDEVGFLYKTVTGGVTAQFVDGNGDFNYERDFPQLGLDLIGLIQFYQKLGWAITALPQVDHEDRENYIRGSC